MGDMADKWQDMDNERVDGKLTDTALALDAISDRGCDCENEGDEDCFAHLCEKAIKEQWTRADAAEKRVAELEALLSRNEGRIKEIVDENLMADRDTERKRANELAGRLAVVQEMVTRLHQAYGNQRLLRPQQTDMAAILATLDAMRPVFQEVIDAWQASRWNRADDSQGERMSTPIEHWERVHDAITAVGKVKP